MSWATAGFSRSWLYAQPGLAERARGGTSGRVRDTVLGAVSQATAVIKSKAHDNGGIGQDRGIHRPVPLLIRVAENASSGTWRYLRPEVGRR